MLKLHRRAIIVFIAIISVFFSSTSVHSQITTPSAAQIEMFKKLPKSQQQTLAKQMGVDLSQLESMGQVVSDGGVEEELPEQQYITEDESEIIDDESEEITEENELKPFGYDMFKQLQEAFLPNGAIPIPADYIVGPGDSVNISLFGKESSQYTLTVDNEGKLVIPDLEPLEVAGLSYSELKAFIADTVKNKMIGIKSAVSIAGLSGIQVYIVGAVENPGAYHLSSLSTVTNALFISGGPSDVGSLRTIKVKRAGKTISTVDLYNLFIHGDVSSDVRLQQGDVVFVESIQSQVSISGEVRRPAVYEVVKGETVSDLIEMAGGLNVNAYPKHAIWARFDENYQRDIRSLNLSDGVAVKQKLNNGDVVTVLPISDRLDQVIHVAGAVSRPTTYAWSSGMTLSEFVTNKDDLLENTDLNYALILSKKPFGQYVVEQFKPSDIFKGLSINLAAGDLVVFFNRFDTGNKLPNNNYIYDIQNGSFFEKQRALKATKGLSRLALIEPINQLLTEDSNSGNLVPVVNITGQVRFPGMYPVPENSTLIDGINAAGGLIESANLFKGELSRIKYFNDEIVKTEHLELNLIDALSKQKGGNIKLYPRDVVNIFQKANWNDELSITLKGEIKYPGTYIVNEGESLEQVIKRAGGLTKFAAVESAFFTRETLRELEIKQAKDMARALSKELALKSISSSVSTINVGEVQQLVQNLTAIEGVGRLVIDLEKVLKGEQKITIESGDELIIPNIRNEVNVIGEVQVATSHIYDNKWTLEDYLTLSGGLKQQADDDRVYIVQANGAVKLPKSGWFSDVGVVDLKPGDTIVVPLDADYTDKLTLWEKATSIFYNSVIALAAINSF